jgi:hypothetical protein
MGKCYTAFQSILFKCVGKLLPQVQLEIASIV